MKSAFGPLNQRPTTRPSTAVTAPAKDGTRQPIAQSSSAAMYAELQLYLSGKNAELQDTAADILANAVQPPPAGFLASYLDGKQPLTVRAAALLADMRFTDAAGRAPRKPAWAGIVNDILAYPVCPPYFRELIEESPWPVSDPAWVQVKNMPMTIRRAMLLFSASNDEQAGRIIASVRGCDAAVLVPELVKWYAIEPESAVRRMLLKNLQAEPTHRAKYAELYQLAKKDWDEVNAGLATERP